MTPDERDLFNQLEARIKHLEEYLQQFSSFNNFGKSPIKQPAKTNSKGTRLSEDWMPSDELIAWAIKDFPMVDLRIETDKFIDYWIARNDAGAIKRSWDRTWRNWIRTAASQHRSQHGTHKPAQPKGLDFNGAVRHAFDD